MNRNSIIAVIVVVIVALGAWYYVSTMPPTPASTSTTGTTTGQATAGTTNTTLRALATQGGNYTCALSNTTSSGAMSGTIYGAGGKTRLDFTIRTNDGTQVMTHTIRNGTYSYTWVEGQTVGTKTAITSSTPIVQQPQGGVIVVNDTSSFASDCHPWSPDATEFTPPAEITFVTR